MAKDKRTTGFGAKLDRQVKSMNAKRILIQLKVSPLVHGDIKRSAEAHGRSVTNEVLSRIGFSDSNKVDQALGDLAAVIAARADSHLGSAMLIFRDTLGPDDKEHRARLLSVVRDGLTFILNRLGADPETIKADDFPIAQGITWDLPNKIRQPDPADQTTEGRTLARIGDALGVRVPEGRLPPHQPM